MTGLYPSSHAIIGDQFAQRSDLTHRFSVNDSTDATDNSWWLGTPIWVYAQRVKKKTALSNWPGAQAQIQGAQVDYIAYNDDSMDQINEALLWLDKPMQERPSLIAIHFPQVASAHCGNIAAFASDQN
ncbi:hypothetical protein HK102_007941 [Quaeritorhiza haematococci]|nr:hypothetical protein HK102_007941 [Quaeritorhiza haematococci]